MKVEEIKTYYENATLGQKGTCGCRIVDLVLAEGATDERRTCDRDTRVGYLVLFSTNISYTEMSYKKHSKDSTIVLILTYTDRNVSIDPVIPGLC